MAFYTQITQTPRAEKKKALKVSPKCLIQFGIFGGRCKFRTCDPCSVNAGARQFCAALRGKFQPGPSKNSLEWQQITQDYTGLKRKKPTTLCGAVGFFVSAAGRWVR
jgi:hypothetical protein